MEVLDLPKEILREIHVILLNQRLQFLYAVAVGDGFAHPRGRFRGGFTKSHVYCRNVAVQLEKEGSKSIEESSLLIVHDLEWVLLPLC